MIPDDPLDVPIVRPIVASDNVTGPDLLSLRARIRRARPHESPLENKTHRGEVRRNQAAVQTMARLRLP
jgi:hypothetical protein